MLNTQVELEKRKIKNDEAVLKDNEELRQTLALEKQRITELKAKVTQLNFDRRKVQDQKDELLMSITSGKNQLKHCKHQLRLAEKDKNDFFAQIQLDIKGEKVYGENYKQSRETMLAQRKS